MNNVLVHSCFNALEPFTIGVGERNIFHFNPNVTCGCTHRISFRERDAKLEYGEIYVVARKNVNGHAVPEWHEVIEARKTHGPPWIQLMTASRLEKAYAFEGSQREVDRIEFWGYLTQLEFAVLGALMRGRRVMWQ